MLNMSVWNTESGTSPNKSESSPGEKNIRPQKLSANGKKSGCIQICRSEQQNPEEVQIKLKVVRVEKLLFALIEVQTGIKLMKAKYVCLKHRIWNKSK